MKDRIYVTSGQIDFEFDYFLKRLESRGKENYEEAKFGGVVLIKRK